MPVFEFVLHELFHVLTFLLVYFLLCRRINERNLIFGAVITLLIDIDHLVDYIFSEGLNFNLNNIIQSEYFAKNGHVFVILHNWEFVIIFYLLYKAFSKSQKFNEVGKLFLVVTIALISHLVLDTLWYQFNPISYSFFYRYFHNFELSLFDL